MDVEALKRLEATLAEIVKSLASIDEAVTVMARRLYSLSEIVRRRTSNVK